jgi:hypothetical protein
LSNENFIIIIHFKPSLLIYVSYYSTSKASVDYFGGLAFKKLFTAKTTVSITRVRVQIVYMTISSTNIVVVEQVFAVELDAAY